MASLYPSTFHLSARRSWGKGRRLPLLPCCLRFSSTLGFRCGFGEGQEVLLSLSLGFIRT